MPAFDDLPHLCPASREEWRSWLAEHHASARGVWLVYHKKTAGKPTVSYDAAVEEALCFGWIDSKTQRVDEERYRQVFTPRKPGSVWSALNKQRIEALVAAGLMTAAGLVLVEAAKADGSWTLLDASEALQIPPDLEAALAADAEALRCFEAFPAGVRKRTLQWVLDARREETRARRVEEVVRLSAQNIRPRP